MAYNKMRAYLHFVDRLFYCYLSVSKSIIIAIFVVSSKKQALKSWKLLKKIIMKVFNYIFVIMYCSVLLSCSGSTNPNDYADSKETNSIYDYM